MPPGDAPLYFIVLPTRASSALSLGSISVSPARSHCKNAGWFLSTAMPTGAAFSLLFWQLLSLGSTASCLSLRPIATQGTRLIGAASARFAITSSTGATPDPATPRSSALGKRTFTQPSSPPPLQYAMVTPGPLRSSTYVAAGRVGSEDK